jgi:hypothetical protein
MGGLVARAALDEFREAELADAVPLLVSPPRVPEGDYRKTQYRTWRQIRSEYFLP